MQVVDKLKADAYSVPVLKEITVFAMAKAKENEHYYRLIPDSEIDIKQLKQELDVGINIILDGLDALMDDDKHRAVDLITSGLSALSYNKYLVV
jgi:hypothetical protein